MIDLRPRKVTISYILHDAPEDSNMAIIDPDAEFHTINYIRSQFYDVAKIPIADRSHELFKRLIEGNGYTAVIMQQVVYFP